MVCKNVPSLQNISVAHETTHTAFDAAVTTGNIMYKKEVQ
jgi:hypothetical protein